MPRRRSPRRVTYFEPVPPRLAPNTIIESTLDVGRRSRCTMRVYQLATLTIGARLAVAEA